MTSTPVVPDHQSDDLDTALIALSPADEPAPLGLSRGSRRALLAALLGVLLVGGIVSVVRDDSASRQLSDSDHVASVFRSAHSGNCLVWQPEGAPRPAFVQCSSPHMFEVVNVVDGDGDQEACTVSVRRYLGPHYDPNSRFTVSLLKQTGSEESDASSRKSLCGLQLAGPDNQPLPFRGLVAQQDQSRVWPPGTCLPDLAGAVPVDCAEPHAVEVVGPVDLNEHFHDGPPSEADQEPILRSACTTMTAAYLAPKTLGATGLTLHYPPVSEVSWAAGSHQALCALAVRNHGTTTGSVRSHEGAAASTAAPAPEPPRQSESPRQPESPRQSEPPRQPESPQPSETEPSHPTTTVATTAPTVTPEPQTSTAVTSASQTAGVPSTSATDSPAQNPPPPADAPPSHVVQIPGLPDITLPFAPPPL